MRHFLAIPLAALLAAPATAAPRDRADAPFVIPPELTDPATAQKLTRMVGALSDALMALPVGDVEAAAEGRPATPADHRRTVGDMVGGPAEAARIKQQVAAAGPAMQAGVRAMANALPAIVQAMDKVEQELDRATASLPQPGYPRR